MIPKKRQRERVSFMEGSVRVFQRHRRWVRSHECCCKSINCNGPIQAAHVRTGTDGGTSLKPSDWWLISLCHYHHAIQHGMGEPEFERRHGIDMKKLANEFADKSPDLKMRECRQSARRAKP